MAPRKEKSSKFISAPLINREKKLKGKVVKYKRKRKFVKQRPERGVVYFSHIPHGFYEEQMKDYCSQFGIVTGLYLPRSKNGNSRGYGFVEFKNPEVAQIVADTMNNYLMFNRLVKAKYLPPEEQRPGVIRRAKYWDNKKLANAQREKTFSSMTRELKPCEEVEQRKKIKRSVKRHHKQLQALAVDYDFKVEECSNEA